MRFSLYILTGVFALIFVASMALFVFTATVWGVVVLWIVAALATALGALTFTAARYMPAAQKRRS